jgi:hypothetical protein
MLEVVSARCRQGGLKRRGPLCVGLGKSPDLIGRQSEVAKQTAERLAGIDAVQKLLARLDRQPLLRSGSAKCSLCVAARSAAQGAAAPAVPAA